MKYTIFTPTYNRGHLLSSIYDSLLNQIHYDFEWLIVDDGSTDNTESLVNDLSLKAPFVIKYIKQTNGGKHRAFNRAIKEAGGDWFICVDSDDPLLVGAVEGLDKGVAYVNDSQAGFAGVFVRPNGQQLGKSLENIIESNTVDIRDKYHRQEDRPEIYKTSILKQYYFPEFEGESFITEAIVFDRLTLKYPLVYTNIPIQIKEYLNGGLTSKMLRIRIESINGSLMYYKERATHAHSVIYKIRARLNYGRFYFHAKKNNKVLVDVNIPFTTYFLFPFAFILFLKDLWSLNTK